MSKGVLLSVSASLLFGVLYYYSTVLAPLDGEQIFGWRLLLTVPLLTAYLLWSGERALIAGIAARLRQPGFALGVLASAALLGVQLWLFMWAPLQGRGLQVSLGYFLLPLIMVLTGRVLYRERLSPLQRAAVACAAFGVGHELVRLGGVSWETLVVALGYPLYFWLRRRLGTGHLGGLWFDMVLLLPLALRFVDAGGAPFAVFAETPRLILLVPLLGAISATALICYIRSARLLPFGLFGLLGYVEPVLLVLVALLLGERIEAGEWLTYVPIWIAVALLVLEGARHLHRRHARRATR